MLLTDLSKIDEVYLQELCDSSTPESDTLDFKKVPPLKGTAGNQEFVKDVCAFANGSGGDIVLGVEEQKSLALALAPISGESADALKRRLLQVLDAGAEPRIHGIQFKDVAVPGGFIMVVRVPLSLDGPHSFVTTGSARRFVTRNQSLTTDMDMTQIRNAFDRRSSLAEAARNFAHARLANIESKKTWRPMLEGPLCAAIVVPLSSVSGGSQIDVRSLYDDFTSLAFWKTGASRAMNLEGLIAYLSTNRPAIGAYGLMHRNGIFEAVQTGAGWISSDKFIPSSFVSLFYRRALESAQHLAQKLDISGPSLLICALYGGSGYQFGVAHAHQQYGQFSLDRDDIILPEIWIEDLPSVDNIDCLVRPTLDVLWQAFGLTHCFDYDDDGQFAPPHF